jgi:hypothetical protein
MIDPDRAAGVIEALRRQASGSLDASIPVNPKDLLVLIAAYDAAAAGVTINPISERYHGPVVADGANDA